MQKESRIIFSLLVFMFLIVDISFAADWQKPWNLEKINAKKVCLIQYDKSTYIQKKYSHNDYISACLKHAKINYDIMQNNFGVSKEQATQLKETCSKNFDNFHMQVRCIKNKIIHSIKNKDILKKCDFNNNGFIEDRKDVLFGGSRVKNAKRERTCNSEEGLKKSEKELKKSEKELKKSEKELKKLKIIKNLLNSEK